MCLKNPENRCKHLEKSREQSDSLTHYFEKIESFFKLPEELNGIPYFIMRIFSKYGLS
jgi:hypothetical protein